MQYGVSLLTFWVTSMLTVITVYLSKQANDTNKRILSFNEKSNAPYLEIVIADSHIAVKEQDTLIVHLEIKNPLDKPVVEITCTLHNQQSSNLFDDLYEFIPERLERGLSTNSRGTVEFYEWKILKSDIYCLYPQKTDAIEIDYTVNDSWKSIIQLNIFFRDVFGKQYKQRISLVIDINNTYEILGYSTEVDKIGDSFRLA